MPKVLHLYKHGIPAGAVYIGRSRRGEPENPFGNPFIPKDKTNAERNRVCDEYKAMLMAQPELIEKVRRELKGKDLVCFCAPKRCHGDLLLAIANSDDDMTENTVRTAGQVCLPGI